jgi:uridine kinase
MTKPLMIGIAGGSGSGKSTVAKNVAELLTTSSVVFIDMDAYYKNFSSLSFDDRRTLNWDHPDAFDYDLLYEHLNALAARKSIEKPEYDFVTHLRKRERTHRRRRRRHQVDQTHRARHPRTGSPARRCHRAILIDRAADAPAVRRAEQALR